MIISLIAAGTGILLACLFYLWKVFNADKLANALGALYRLVLDKYRFDELYQKTFIRWTTQLSTLLYWVDRNIIDGVVNGVGAIMHGFSKLSAAADRNIVDGLVNLVGETTVSAGQLVRRLQTGRIQQYAYMTFVGVALIAAVVLLELI